MDPVIVPSTLEPPPSGLTSVEASHRLAVQRNDFHAPTSRPVSEILRANVFTRFNALLGGLCAVMVVVGPLQDALFGVTVVANAAVGIVQEMRAKRVLDRLTVVTTPAAVVVRDGRRQSVRVQDLVVDDVLMLNAGDQVPVDGDVLSSREISLDESILTGESVPVTKLAGDQVLSGSVVVAGAATCRVTGVGADSYAARIASEARKFQLARSELRDGINRILRLITWIIVPIGGLLAWSQLARHGSLTDAVRGAVAGTVTMVPEGLVLLSSVAFAAGAVRLARHNVLARELPSIEGLARVDTLCIDKTGTLTTGHLTLETVDVLTQDSDLEAAIAALARMEERPNATMQALAARFTDTRSDWVVVGRHPFSSATKWSGLEFADHGCWVVGAPELLTPDPGVRSAVARVVATGSRVVLVARATAIGPAGVTGVLPVALLGLRDETRPDAARTLDYLAAQGIAVKVLSGDHPETVAAVCRELGLDTGEPVDARGLDTDRAGLSAVMNSGTVFGRVTPEQKRSMVAALQGGGHVVAMTGDGVNDVLALKAADVGMAMGAGAPAARAVAQLVLIDNSFTAVPTIIAEGRRVIANMERVANLFLTKTVYATILALTIGVARLPFPFLPRHLTLVSTLTIGVPAFFLALGPNDARARAHFLRRVARFAIPAGLVAAAGTYMAYLRAIDITGTSLAGRRTLATLVLFAIALWILRILIRTSGNREWWLVPLMAGIAVAALAAPAARSFFAVELPSLPVLIEGGGIAGAACLALDAGWRIAHRFNGRR